MSTPRVDVVDLGPMSYAAAYEHQVARVDSLLAARPAVSGHEASSFDNHSNSPCGTLFLVEHVPPVITLTRRSAPNLLASPELLARHGIETAATDRGGDITYHGPGQLIAYPILDLQRLGFGLHEYMRFLEEVVIRTISRWGITGERERGATGVWVHREAVVTTGAAATVPRTRPPEKIAAMGVRLRKWVSMHGLALNVDPDLSHFALIVPCGLADRGVTSMARELREGRAAVPTMLEVKAALIEEFVELLNRSCATSGTNKPY